MATLFKPMDVQVDGDGISMAGAKIYFYQTGTSTPQDTFSQSDLDPSHVNPNPVVANADGLWPPIYLGLTDYKAILKTAADVTVQTIDPVLVNPQAASLSDDFDDEFGSTQYSLLQRGASDWEAVTLKAVLDNKFGTTQGNVIYRSASDWAALAPPSVPSALTLSGTAANPAWQANRKPYARGTQSGGTVTLVKSSEISSIAKLGAGHYEVTISPAMPDANYRFYVFAGVASGNFMASEDASFTNTTTKFRFYTGGDGAGGQDPDTINVEVFV